MKVLENKMKALVAIPALALIATLVGGPAHADPYTCANKSNQIMTALYNDSRLSGQVGRSGYDVSSISNDLSNIADDIRRAGPNVDLDREIGSPLDGINQQVLGARQAMYNVRALLNELLQHPEMDAGMKAIVHNALNNNLGPAERANDAAMAATQSLKSTVSRINQGLKNSAQLDRLGGRVAAHARQLYTSSGFVQNSSQTLVNDLDYIRADIPNLVRACQNP